MMLVTEAFLVYSSSVISFLLLHITLLDLSFLPVHLHGNLLRLVAVVLGDGEGSGDGIEFLIVGSEGRGGGADSSGTVPVSSCRR